MLIKPLSIQINVHFKLIHVFSEFPGSIGLFKERNTLHSAFTESAPSHLGKFPEYLAAPQNQTIHSPGLFTFMIVIFLCLTGEAMLIIAGL